MDSVSSVLDVDSPDEHTMSGSEPKGRRRREVFEQENNLLGYEDEEEGNVVFTVHHGSSFASLDWKVHPASVRLFCIVCPPHTRAVVLTKRPCLPRSPLGKVKLSPKRAKVVAEVFYSTRISDGKPVMLKNSSWKKVLMSSRSMSSSPQASPTRLSPLNFEIIVRPS